jgi:hypothetical protein
VRVDQSTFLVFGVANASTFNATEYEKAIRNDVCVFTVTCTVTVSLGSRRRLNSGASAVEATVERQSQCSSDRCIVEPIDGAAVASSIEAETGTATTLQEETQTVLSATATVERMAPSAESSVDESFSSSALAAEVGAEIRVPASAVTVTQTLAAPPPPPPPPGAVNDAIVEVVLEAEGDVSDYPPSTLSAYAAQVADAAGVDASQVSASVQPASVIITFVIVVPPATSAGDVSTALNSAMGTPALASGLLGITVTGVEIDDGSGGDDRGGGGGGMSIGVIAGATVGGALVLILVAVGVFFLLKRRREGGGGGDIKHSKAIAASKKVQMVRAEMREEGFGGGAPSPRGKQAKETKAGPPASSFALSPVTQRAQGGHI